MRKELLQIVPKEFLCPICREWHNIPPFENYSLGSFNQARQCDFTKLTYHEYEGIMKGFYVQDIYRHCFRKSVYKIYVMDDKLHYFIKQECWEKNFKCEGEISIEAIEENENDFSIKFDVNMQKGEGLIFEYEEDVHSRCKICDYRNRCFYYKSKLSTLQHFQLGFRFYQKDYNPDSYNDYLAKKERIRQMHERISNRSKE